MKFISVVLVFGIFTFCVPNKYFTNEVKEMDIYMLGWYYYRPIHVNPQNFFLTNALKMPINNKSSITSINKYLKSLKPDTNQIRSVRMAIVIKNEEQPHDTVFLGINDIIIYKGNSYTGAKNLSKLIVKNINDTLSPYSAYLDKK